MKIRSVTVVGAAAAAAVCLSGVSAIATPAVAATPAKAGDFNGDGRRDIAAGSPWGKDGSVANAGFVTVVYGGSGGPNTAKRQVIGQSSAGIPDGPEAYDEFGAALASADFDRDGYADLAIGAPGEDGGGAPIDGGRVTIVFGSASGLSQRAVTFAQGSRFGTSLAAGDFDGNGTPDLAVGALGEFWVYRSLQTGDLTGTKIRVGSSDGEIAHVAMAAADYTGDGKADLAYTLSWSPISGDGGFQRLNIYQGSDSGLVSEPIWSEQRSYTALTAGDVNGDGKADLVAGGENQIQVRLGTGTGLGAAKVIDQDTAGVPGTDESGDGFGDTLAAGDVNGDGKSDIAVGAPGEDVGTATNAGAATVLYGSAEGLTGTGAQMIGQDTAGVPGTAEKNDYFGQGVSLADVTGDGKADLTAGAKGENSPEGAVWVMPGAQAGVQAAGSKAFNSGTLGVSQRNAELGGVLLP